MKALVLGGNRFFGKRLAQLLLQRGLDVTLLNRGQLADDFGDRVQRIKMDRRKINRETSALANQKWDIIYDHICFDAAEAKAACEAFRGKTKHYVFISSQSVYAEGASLLEEAVDPFTHPFEPSVNRDQDYGEAKRQAEAVFFQTNSFPVTAVRLPIVLGEDDYTERLKQHVKWVQEGKAIFFPAIEAKISFVQSSDAAKFLAAQADRALLGPVNCCSQEPIVLKNVMAEIERATGKTAIIKAKEGEGEPSPFGIESDWYMNTQKIRDYGFSAEPIENWLPGLIQKLK